MYGPREACGIFAIISDEEPVFPYVYWGLVAQNHRGHQSHGIATFDSRFHLYRKLDLVPEIEERDKRKWFEALPGRIGLGHVRYTTSGGTTEEALTKGIQPSTAPMDSTNPRIALSFNGNVVNILDLKKEIGKKISGFSCECDGDIICNKLLLGLDRGLHAAVKDCMETIDGAFSVAGIADGRLFAFRDPHGIKPLSLGHGDGIYAVSSETVGLDINGLEHGMEVKPGELVVISEKGMVKEQIVPCKRRALCAFEFAYFARPDSFLVEDEPVYEIREEFGRNLGRCYAEVIKKLDVIVSVPETGDDAAYGLHEETGLRWERSNRRHRYVTRRAFIQLEKDRHNTIDRKINVLPKLNGKKVAVVEDSIVRGDTTKTIIQKLRRKGAREVHLFVTYPRIIGSCCYGIDMATLEELIGAEHEPEKIARIIGADSVNYQSVENYVHATGLTKGELCLGCVIGIYPTPLGQELADRGKEDFKNGVKTTKRFYE